MEAYIARKKRLGEPIIIGGQLLPSLSSSDAHYKSKRDGIEAEK